MCDSSMQELNDRDISLVSGGYSLAPRGVIYEMHRPVGRGVSGGVTRAVLAPERALTLGELG